MDQNKSENNEVPLPNKDKRKQRKTKETLIFVQELLKVS